MTRHTQCLLGSLGALCLWFTVAVPRSPAAPRVGIEATSNGDIQLSWHQPDEAMVPEWTASLNPPVEWTPLDEFRLLPDGQWVVELPIGGSTRFFRLRGAPLTTLKETSPANGESGVAVTRETVFRFSQPLATNTVLGIETLFAEFGGQRMLSRAELSSDRRLATLFYLENLPGNARVRVTLRGDELKDVFGRPIDADGDGQSGGSAQVEFDTSSLAPVPKTAVIGRVFASELVPAHAGEGALNRPLAGVTITLDGLEESVRTTTDAQGNFKLSPVPGGRFFVHVDGRTSVGSQWPGGAYYPFVGKAWEAIAGREDNPANGTGVIYLPLVSADTLQAVSATEDTTVGFPPGVLRRNPELTGVTVTVPANALFNENGTRGGKVGIAPVSPDRLPEPLPPGLRFPLVITVQTDGPMNFDRPAPVRFPNLPDAETGEVPPPGAKSALWSFNHDTGLWEIGGSMTVSEDGRFLESDPGVGIRQPGWHASAPGSQGTGGSGSGQPCQDTGCSLGGISVFSGPKAQRTFSVPSAHSQGIVNWFVPGASPQGGAGDSFTATFCSAGDHEVRAVLLSNCGQQRCEKVITVTIPDSEAPPQDPCTLLKPLILHTPPPHIAGADPQGAVVFEDPSPSPIGGTICYEFEGADQLSAPCAAGGLFVGAVWCQPGTYRLRRTLTMSCGTQCTMDDGTITIVPPSPAPNCFVQIRMRSLFAFVDTLEEFTLDTGGRVGHVEWHLPGAVPETDARTFDNVFETFLYTPGTATITAIFTDCTTGQSCTAALLFDVNPTPPVAPVPAGFPRQIPLSTSGRPGNSGAAPSLQGSANGEWRMANQGSRAQGLKSLHSRENIAIPNPRLAGGNGLRVAPLLAPQSASQPSLRLASDQTRLRGLIYFALVDVRTDRIARGIAGADGILHPQGIQVAPAAPYREHILHAATLRTGTAEFTSAPNGSRFEMPTLHLDTERGPDADLDGLSDLAELIVGSDPANPDTDGDSVRDGPEVQSGGDPISGLSVRTGVVTAASTPAPAVDISAANDVAAVACRDFGLVLFNVFSGLDPVRIAQVETPGEALRVASAGGVAAVADGTKGLAIVDLTDPPSARIRNQVSLGAPVLSVALDGGFALAGTALGSVSLVDLATGSRLAETPLDGAVLDLVPLGDLVVALTPTKLHVLADRGTLTPLGSVDLANTETPRRLFAADEHAFVVHRNGAGAYRIGGGVPRFLQALITETVTIPEVGWEHLVLNGSGTALSVHAQPLDTPATRATVWSLPAPTGPMSLIEGFDFQGTGRAVSIYNGIAYLAADTGGLQVINFLARDLGRQAPTLALSASFPLQPATVVEGQRARITALVGDDVQVRNVTFIIDGVPAAIDGNYPFEFRFTTPLRTRQTTFTLSASATDTGGNVTSTVPVTVTVTGDTVPPRVLAVSPRDGATHATTRTLAVFLDEPAAPGSFAADRWRLREAGPDGQMGTTDDEVVAGGSIEEQPDSFAGLLHFPADLPPGLYRAELLPGVRDLAGNVRGETHGWSFTLTGVRPASGPRLATGQDHTLVIEPDGSLWGWGSNGGGQIGDGGPRDQGRLPVRVGTSTEWTTVAAARRTTAAIRGDGSLWTWGNGDGDGLLGQGSGVSQLESPTRVGADSDWSAVMGGTRQFLALKTEGSLWAWGANEDGVFGDPTIEGSDVPVRVGSDRDWAAISTGGEEGTLALKRDGSIWFWDGNARTKTDLPSRIGIDHDWVAIAATGSEILPADSAQYALKSDGTLWYLGYLTGDSLPSLASPPRTLRFARWGSDADWSGLWGGAQHLLARKTDGSLWAIGDNDLAQLGDGELNGRTNFVRVALGGEVVALATRFDHNVALTGDGIYHTWGDNRSGQYGLGFVGTPQPTPLQVGADTNWVSVDYGQSFAVALRSEGALWSWGQGFDGQLGVDSQESHTAPVRIGAEASWTAVAAGNRHALALRQDGTLWGWGANYAAQLGVDPNQTNRRLVPAQIGADRDWALVAAGYDYSLALKNDGSLWAWGDNAVGQLGDGTAEPRPVPTRIGSDSDWRLVVSGGVPGRSTFALKQDGSLWVWGENRADFQFSNGDFLGVGDTLRRLSPVRLSGTNLWQDLSVGLAEKRAIRGDGTLWSWLGVKGGGALFRQVEFFAGSTGFYDSDLLAVSPLATRLVTHTDGPSLYLWDLMDPTDGTFDAQSRATLSDPAAPSAEKANVLVQVLSVAANGPLLFTPDRFANVTLSGETQALLSQNPTGNALVELNRRLLEDAYPTELARFGDRVWASVAVGDNHLVGVRRDGTRWGEGSNSSGELGNGQTTTRLNVLQPLDGDRDWRQIKAGRQVSAGIRRDGTLWTWGDYGGGLLGVPSLLQPHAIGNATNWTARVAGTAP